MGLMDHFLSKDFTYETTFGAVSGYLYLSDSCVLGSSFQMVIAVGPCYTTSANTFLKYKFVSNIVTLYSYTNAQCSGTGTQKSQPHSMNVCTVGSRYLNYKATPIDTTFYNYLGATAATYSSTSCTGNILTLMFSPFNVCSGGNLAAIHGHNMLVSQVGNAITFAMYADNPCTLIRHNVYGGLIIGQCSS